jgi:hypothetical protein
MMELLAFTFFLVLGIWLFRVSYLLRRAHGWPPIVAIIFSVVVLMFWYVTAPYYLYRYLSARRRVKRVIGGEDLGAVFRRP